MSTVFLHAVNNYCLFLLPGNQANILLIPGGLIHDLEECAATSASVGACAVVKCHFPWFESANTLSFFFYHFHMSDLKNPKWFQKRMRQIIQLVLRRWKSHRRDTEDFDIKHDVARWPISVAL